MNSKIPACTSDACDCGNKPCPTPQACEVWMWDVEHSPVAFVCYVAAFLIGLLGAVLFA